MPETETATDSIGPFDLLTDALDGDDLARIALIMRLCLIETDAARSAGAARMAETSENRKVYLA